jgi:hypothetical protein
MESVKDFIIYLIKKKKIICSSYFIHNIFTSIGYFFSVSDIIEEMNKDEYLKHEGYFDGTSGLVKNITLTDKGEKRFKEINILKTIEQMEASLGKSDLLDKIKESIYNT